MTPPDLRQRTITVLFALFVFVIAFKFFHLRYAPDLLIPISGYKVEINAQLECGEGEVEVLCALPSASFRQSIFNEKENAGALGFTSYGENGNRFGRWGASHVSGLQRLNYAFSVKTQRVVYHLPDSLPHVTAHPDSLANFLKAPNVANSPLKDALGELQLGKSANLLNDVKRVYDFTIQTDGTSDFKDGASPLNLLHTEGADSSKSSLFVALLRSIGIPARLAGGLIAPSGKSAIVHHWAEAYLGNQWVSFDPAHQHYAALPANYIKFYHGDETLFRHTENVNLSYTVKAGRHVFPKENDFATLASYPWNIMNAWPYFERAGVPLDLLRMIVMIPLGAIVTIVFRNVIGAETFGTFLPVLIAAAFQETGLFFGLLTFAAIILTGAILGAALHRLRILYAPRLTIVLVYVVIALFSISFFSMKFVNVSLGHAALFPLAVLAITIERFSLLAEENGVKKALTLLANTALTVIFCYLVINSVFLQSIVLAFPETMLLVIGVSIYLGAWKGLRLNELLRFRGLIFKKTRTTTYELPQAARH